MHFPPGPGTNAVRRQSHEQCDAGNFFLRVQPFIYKSTIPLVLNACLMLRVIVFLLHGSFPAKYIAQIGRNKAIKAKLLFFPRNDLLCCLDNRSSRSSRNGVKRVKTDTKNTIDPEIVSKNLPELKSNMFLSCLTRESLIACAEDRCYSML